MTRAASLLGVVLLAVAVASAPALVACEPLEDEEPLEPPEPVRTVGPIREISPKVALLGQTLRVTITIDGDRPGAESSVDFGAGVDVIGVSEVVGGVAAEIQIDEDTSTGPRDVTVTPADAPKITASAAFSIAAAVDVAVASGRAEQGGIALVELTSKDGRTFSDATFTVEGAADPGVPTLNQIGRGPFIGTKALVYMLADPLAKTGPLSLVAMNNPSDPRGFTFYAPDAIDVAARAPVSLVAGTPSVVTLANPLETAFYDADFTPQANEGLLVDAHAVTPGGSTLRPLVYAYPASGNSEELLDLKEVLPGSPPTGARVGYPVTKATKGFFVVFDRDFAASATSSLSFEVDTYRASITAEASAPHPVASPQDLGTLPPSNDAVPGIIVTGRLDAVGEVDAYVLGGFPSGVRDIQVSILSDAEVDVIVDHVPGFDEDPTTFTTVHRAATGKTTGFADSNRFLQVFATPGATKKTGSYTLGVRAIN